MKESLDISKDNLQDAAKSYNNCNEPNMKEILLIKCDTYIKHSIFLFYMLFNVIFKLQYSNNFLYMAI